MLLCINTFVAGIAIMALAVALQDMESPARELVLGLVIVVFVIFIVANSV